MLEIKDFKDESIIILNKKIEKVNDKIIYLVNSLISTEFNNILDLYEGEAYILELMDDINANMNVFDEQDKKTIEKINKKIEEYCCLLKRRILIKIRYGDIAKYEIPDSEENFNGIIFLHQPDEYDEIIMEFNDKIFSNLNEYDYLYSLSSTEYGSIERIIRRLNKIYSNPKVLSNKVILKRLKPKQKTKNL